MHEADLKRIVEEVVRTLAGKGFLKEGPCGCPSPKPSSAIGGYGKPGGETSRVTIGTAGKVFSDEWRPAAARPQSAMPVPTPRRSSLDAAPALPSRESGIEHTGSGSCPQCAAVSGLKGGDLAALGVNRLAVCSPTKKGSRVTAYVDHTLLKPNATQAEVAKLCEEAKDYCFASVCINPSNVAHSASLLRGSGVKVCTVVGFPLGSTTSTVKAIEARDAIANGADEIDMVINVGALKSGNDSAVYDDIHAVREATRGRVLKVILETALLTDEEKVRACVMSKKAGADFVKTSTGFGGGGATAEDIRLMRETVGPLMGVKASGGIRDAQAAAAMIAAGATRLGTSASIAIVTDAKSGGGKGY